MDSLARKIKERVTDNHSRLTMVRNADGFLSRPDTQETVRREYGVLLLPVKSGIELRVRFEVEDRSSEQNVCYIVGRDTMLLPDMKPYIKDKGSINLSDLMPAYDALQIKKAALSWSMASDMYKQKYAYNLSSMQTQDVLKSAENIYGDSIEKVTEDLCSIKLEWDNPQTIHDLSEVILRAIRNDSYDAIEKFVSQINDDFQMWLNQHYSVLSSASHYKSPKLVNSVLPHIAYKHDRQEKLALIVIDGMTYWQYLVLDKYLRSSGMQPVCDMTMAWIPTITKLSRQAIFRGDNPLLNYQQTPSAEERLWKSFWTSPSRKGKRMDEYELAYEHGSLCTGSNAPMRLALVDVELDEKMHASTDNKDLYSLTDNWARRAAEDILAIHNMGYTIYLTTDHGNILSHGWRGLNSQEKTFLYKDGSRGTRHLIYNDVAAMNDFIAENTEVSDNWMHGDKWLVWRTNQCFKASDCITHGGSHFLEVVIPFIKINSSTK